MLHELDAINKLMILVQWSLTSLPPPLLPGSRWEPMGVMVGHGDIGLESKMGQVCWQLQYKILMGEVI